MSTKQIKNTLANRHELSALPQTLAEVLRITGDENSSVKDLATVLMRDPALTTKLLRVVNSPFYGTGRKTTTVTQAAMTLGMRAVSALALSTSVYNMTEKKTAVVDHDRFWRHSVETAVAARMIANKVGYRCPEEAFVCGLLHDIGLLILDASYGADYARIWKVNDNETTLIDREETAWGTNHARVGQFLLEQWGLPSEICAAVGSHHTDTSAMSDEKELVLPRIVAMANSISRYRVREAIGLNHPIAEQLPALCRSLALSSEDRSEIENALFDQTVQEASFLDIPIGSLEELMAEANQMLYSLYMTVEGLLDENKRMHRQLAQAAMEKMALDNLRTITATFSHFINNATATIQGRAQLIQASIEKGSTDDSSGSLDSSMGIIVQSVDTICVVIDELKKLSTFDTMTYHNDAHILDIEKRVQERLEQVNSNLSTMHRSPVNPT
ncbi:MAG: HDOD domain-containing protein [Candidatus Zixiibacteriota bacterium]